MSVFFCGIIVFLTFAIVPSWTDYVAKDYVVYTGDFAVRESNTKYRGHISLENGTTITGTASFDIEDSNGIIVYSKRSKITLGGQK